jgi:hypothetical protein
LTKQQWSPVTRYASPLLKGILKEMSETAIRLEAYRAAFERLVAELEQRAQQERVNG